MQALLLCHIVLSATKNNGIQQRFEPAAVRGVLVDYPQIAAGSLDAS